MFAYIKGKLVNKGSNYIIVEANGIGYRINTALPTIQAAGAAGGEIQIHTHLYVREDIMSLYGFFTLEELRMFELLISVSGIGPKAAISIISSLSPSTFSLAVITGDAKTLSKAQGIGNKTAQKVILELRDKVKKEQLSAADDSRNLLMSSTGRGDSVISEAISALMILGYTAVEAGKAVTSVYSEGMGLEMIIKSSLKEFIRT